MDSFFAGMLVMYVAAGAIALGVVCLRNNKRLRAGDTLFVVVTLLVWPLFVDHIIKRIMDASAAQNNAAQPFLCAADLSESAAAVSAPAGARVEESPGVIAFIPPAKQGEPWRGADKPTHILCIGWPTIYRLAKEGMIWDAEHECGIVAADDLAAFDFTEYKYGPRHG